MSTGREKEHFVKKDQIGLDRIRSFFFFFFRKTLSENICNLLDLAFRLRYIFLVRRCISLNNLHFDRDKLLCNLNRVPLERNALSYHRVLSQKRKCHVPVNSKTAHLPQANPGAIDFFENFWSNSPLDRKSVV